MLAWLTLQNLKYVAIAALISAAVWWHFHAVTKAYRQGATEGEQSALATAAAKVEADTAAKRKELDDRQDLLDAEALKNQSDRDAINLARAGIKNSLDAGLAKIATQGIDIQNAVKIIPDDAVNGRFRESLARARSSERQLAAQP